MSVLETRVTATEPPTRRFRPRGVGGLVLSTAVALGILIVGWELTATLSGNWVPSLEAIGRRMVQVLGEPRTYENILLTSWRILIAFVGSTLLGMIIGIAMGMSRRIEAFFRPLVVIALAIPDPVYIIFAILILGTDPSSGHVALVLAVLPLVINIVDSAVRARDGQLDDMARVYRFGSPLYVSKVLLRQIAPAFVLAMRTSFAFSWKVVVLVETMSQPNGVGEQIYQAFRLLRADQAIAVAIVFIVLMRLVDTVVFGLIERRLLAWSQR